MKLKFVILSKAENSYSVSRLKEAATQRGNEVEVINPCDLYLYVSETDVDGIYNKGTRVRRTAINAIIPRIAGETFNFGVAVVRHFQNLGTFSTASSQGLLNASDKFLCSQILSERGVSTPKTIIAHRPEDYGFLIDKVGGLPAVAKLQKGSKGLGVFLLETPLAASTGLESMATLGSDSVIQRKIDTGEPASDIRAIVVDGEVVAAYRRYSLEQDFRSNYSISGEGEKVVLTQKQKNLAVKAADAVNLAVCGVDIMEEREKKGRTYQPTGRNYVIEVNGNPGLKGVETVTGIDVAGKIIEYVERSLNDNEEKRKAAKEQALKAGFTYEGQGYFYIGNIRTHADIYTKNGETYWYQFGDYHNWRKETTGGNLTVTEFPESWI